MTIETPATCTLTWQPLGGEPVTVSLLRTAGPEAFNSAGLWEVRLASDPDRLLGEVFCCSGSWRWRRAGVAEMRGSRLGSRDQAVRDLLWCSWRAGALALPSRSSR